MRLSLVSQHLLVFISVLSLTRAQTTTEQTTFPIITSATTPATITPATTTSASTTSAPTTTTATTTSAPPTTTATTTSAPTTTTATTTSAPTTTTTTSAPTTTPATTTSAPTTTTATTTSAPTTTTTSAPTTTPATTTTTTSASASALSTTPATTASGPATTTFALTTTLAGITTTTVTTTTTTTTKSLTDPCYKYTVLDDPWRSPDYRYTQNMCDANVNWVGWYRLFINGQSAQMSETCVNIRSCGTNAPMWLNGTHPTVEDGVVNRDVCGSWSNCCSFPYSIKVKACPGGYYVYEFVRLNVCNAAYCAVRNNNLAVTSEQTLAAPKIFYPFSSAAGDTRSPAVEDGSSSVIQLLSPFLFFGRTYRQIYVNNNGHLTFNQDSSAYTPYSFPSNGSQDIIAGLWTDLDNRVKGVVSYQQYTNGSVLTNVTQDINTYFPNLNFNASWVFVATWNKVAYFNLTNTETSFQVLLISGSNYSFILMNYGDIAVTDHPVQAGYDTINSTQYFVIPGSNSGSSISNLRNSSNVNVPGRWAFRVDSGSRNSILKNNVVGFQVRLSSFSDLTQSGNIEIVLQQMKQELVKFGLPNSIELKLRKLQKIKP